MPRLVLPPIDKKTLKGAELSAAFTAMASFLNAPTLVEDNFRKMAVEYRHISMPPTVDLWTEDTEGSVNISAGAWSGYHVLLNTVQVIQSPHTGLDNVYETNRNVFQVEAKVHHSNEIDAAVLADRYAIGHTDDGGVTWVPFITETSRPAKRSCGHAWQYFDGTQTHPYNGTPGWYPPNINRDRHIILTAAFGGESLYRTGPSFLASQKLVAVMVNSNIVPNVFPHVQMSSCIRWLENTI